MSNGGKGHLPAVALVKLNVSSQQQSFKIVAALPLSAQYRHLASCSSAPKRTSAPAHQLFLGWSTKSDLKSMLTDLVKRNSQCVTYTFAIGRVGLQAVFDMTLLHFNIGTAYGPSRIIKQQLLLFRAHQTE